MTFEHADQNSDGVVDRKEWEQLQFEAERARLQDLDLDRNAKRTMTYFCLMGMLFFPSSVILTEWLKLPAAGQLLSSMANIYYPSVSLVVGSYFAFSVKGSK